MKSIKDLELKNKRILMRVDFNIPLNNNFEISDDTRMRAALPSIKYVLEQGGSLVIVSHLGRPKNGPEEKFSLKHIVNHLSDLIGVPVKFAKDCIGSAALEQSSNLQAGEVLLLENVRFYYAEETSGNQEFASKLKKHGDVYINDAFGTSHRAHASTATVAQYFNSAKAPGFLMDSELENANKVMANADRPYCAIMGGAKVSDKIMIIENLLEKVDDLIIGGGMVYTFFKAMGGSIGNSLCEDDKMELAKSLLEKAKAKNVNIHLPVDSKIADDFSNDANTALANNTDIPDEWMGLDIGHEAINVFTEVIKKAKTILWNGPMGVFEMKNFENGTLAIAQAVAEATSKGAYSLIGGGDSAAAVNKFGFENQVSYVSTGGGALLEYMEGKELPGVAALKD